MMRLVVAGKVEDVPSEGHQVFLQGIVRDLRDNERDLIFFGDGSIVDTRLKRSSFVARIFLLIKFRFPWQSTLYGNLANVRTLSKYHGKLTYMYFPDTCLLAYRLSKRCTYYYPDLHSYYYYQIFQKTGKLAYLLRVYFYARAERSVRKLSDKVHFLGVTESIISGGMNVWLSHFSKQRFTDKALAREKYFICFRPEDTLVNLIRECHETVQRKITIVSKFSALTYPSYVSHVEDYHSTISKYRFQLLFDSNGSGSSTKLIDCFLSGVIPVGNIVAWRNYEHIGFKYNLIFNSEDSFISILSTLSNMSYEDYGALADEILVQYEEVTKMTGRT